MIAAQLNQPLPAYTRKTITDVAILKRTLATVRKARLAFDEGESAPSIQAFAALIFGKDGSLMVALSIPFLLGAPESRTREFKAAAIRFAQSITSALND